MIRYAEIFTQFDYAVSEGSSGSFGAVMAYLKVCLSTCLVPSCKTEVCLGVAVISYVDRESTEETYTLKEDKVSGWRHVSKRYIAIFIIHSCLLYVIHQITFSKISELLIT